MIHDIKELFFFHFLHRRSLDSSTSKNAVTSRWISSCKCSVSNRLTKSQCLLCHKQSCMGLFLYWKNKYQLSRDVANLVISRTAWWQYKFCVLCLSDNNLPLITWPPRSPNLTPCNFFLWKYVKDTVDARPMPETLQEFKERVCAVIRTIDSVMQRNVWNELD